MVVGFFLDDSIFKRDQVLQSKQPHTICFPLLHSVARLWVCLPVLCPKLPLLPFPKGETIPKGMVTTARFLGEFKSSLLFVACTTSHKFSMGQGFWWETTGSSVLRCVDLLHLSLQARTPPNCWAKKEPCFSCIWQHWKNMRTLKYLKWWFFCHVIHWFQCNARQVLCPLAPYSLKCMVTR